MIRATIVLKFKSGESFTYANKYLVKKEGNDGLEKNPTPLIEGIPGTCYYYTGEGTDTYDKQTGKGKAKGDYEHLLAQVGKTGKVKFPEADSSHTDTEEITRNYDETINSKLTSDRFSFNAADLVSVVLNEHWITYPGDDLDRESRYQLPKTSPNFRGFQESKEEPLQKFYSGNGELSGKGPDFDKNFERNNGFIPNPVLSIKEKNLVVVNEKEYDSVEKKETETGYEVFGIKNGKKSGTTYIAKK